MEHARRPYAFLVARAPDFLNWRYCDPRAGDFTSRAAMQDGRMLGYVVYRTSHARGYIADLIALPGRDDIVAALVSHATSELLARSAEHVQVWCAQGHPYRDTLARVGYSETLRHYVARFVAYRGHWDALWRIVEPGATVHLMAGDTDLV
jgi:hypothetical protein